MNSHHGPVKDEPEKEKIKSNIYYMKIYSSDNIKITKKIKILKNGKFIWWARFSLGIGQY